MKIFVVGAGRLGRALIAFFAQGGHEIVGASNRTAAGAAAARERTGVDAVVSSSPVLPAAVDMVWITVPDRNIASVAAAMHAQSPIPPSTVLVHAAGALPAAVLRNAVPSAGGVAAAHPLQTFADSRRGPQMAREAVWFLEGDAEAQSRVRELLHGCGARTRPLPTKDRALYHAAAVLASNALVALASAATRALGPVGLGREEALAALLPLMSAAVRNLAAEGLPRALTGPIARGDAAVVAAHVRALAAVVPDVREAYTVLAKETVRLARELGEASAEELDAVSAALTSIPARIQAP
ncbi:MAG: DUF2520 domain-containing protein [Candidatus Schekmanbacteria bacterium]|nr:DUF2520 domain-containing protein [Candidatus Schekmanbacteria bacterium]